MFSGLPRSWLQWQKIDELILIVEHPMNKWEDKLVLKEQKEPEFKVASYLTSLSLGFGFCKMKAVFSYLLQRKMYSFSLSFEHFQCVRPLCSWHWRQSVKCTHWCEKKWMGKGSGRKTSYNSSNNFSTCSWKFLLKKSLKFGGEKAMKSFWWQKRSKKKKGSVSRLW